MVSANRRPAIEELGDPAALLIARPWSAFVAPAALLVPCPSTAFAAFGAPFVEGVMQCGAARYPPEARYTALSISRLSSTALNHAIRPRGEEVRLKVT